MVLPIDRECEEGRSGKRRGRNYYKNIFSEEGEKMRKSNFRFASIILAILSVLLLSGRMAHAISIPTQFDKEGIPDFGQYYDASWSNYCAPTSAANSVWYFAMNGYEKLAPINEWGNVAEATFTINELASLMDTNGQTTNPPNPWDGSRDPDIRDGLQTYLDFYYPQSGSVYFDVDLVYAQAIGGGQKLWDFMRRELYRCQDVLALISWWNPTQQRYVGGHAVTMTGYNGNSISINDPATSGSTHNWDGEYLDIDINSFALGWIELDQWASAGTSIPRLDAVVVACPVPEPCTIILFGGGMFGFAIRGLRRRRKSNSN